MKPLVTANWKQQIDIKRLSIMKRALIVSPFSEEKEADIAYAREAMRWCLDGGMAPFVGQLLYGEILVDRVPSDRKLRFNAD
ncbi:hypothetical protein N9K16_00305 [Alphaproteobacteria bacterium]|nr:hypothetical protein [Alphaproteobacteria bacterium]